MTETAPFSVADEIAKLNRLRGDGVISDDEFQKQKEVFLKSGAAPGSPSAATTIGSNELRSIPLRSRWWFQLAILWLVIPVGIILMLTCAAYQERKGQVVRITKGTKSILIMLALLTWVFASIRLFAGSNSPGGSAQSPAATTGAAQNVEAQASAADSKPSSGLPECDSAELQNAVKQAVADKLATLGLPMGSLGNMYSQLKQSHSEPSEAIKRNFSRQNGIPFEDIEMCSVATDSGEMLVTLVAVRNGEIGGAVGNFGVPGVVAEFGQM